MSDFFDFLKFIGAVFIIIIAFVCISLVGWCAFGGATVHWAKQECKNCECKHE